jgi:hypothetical protein
MVSCSEVKRGTSVGAEHLQLAELKSLAARDSSPLRRPRPLPSTIIRLIFAPISIVNPAQATSPSFESPEGDFRGS